MSNALKILSANNSLALLAALAAAPAHAEEARSPAALPDNTYLSIVGTVESITDSDEFMLRYKGGTIKVDTNDYWPNLFSADAAEALRTGDRVMVTGLVDDNFFTAKEIDANNITLQGKNYSRVYSYNSNNTTYWPYYYGQDQNMSDGRIALTGRVSKILPNDSFELSYGTQTIKVDAKDINVMQKSAVKTGDRVTVYGDIDESWYGKQQLDADYLVRTSTYQARG